MKSVQGGYTILEMMIVLAVSAAMFITAVVAIGGRQQAIQFSQSVRDFESRLKDVMNDVSTGYFDNANGVACTVGANPNDRPQPDGTSAVPGTQGTSNECVFIGKVVHFDVNAQNKSAYNIYNVLGKRNVGTSSPSNLDESKPVAVAPADTADFFDLRSEVNEETLDWGLRVTRMYQGGNDLAAIAFFTSFSNSAGVGLDATDISNNQSVRYGGIDLPLPVGPRTDPLPEDIVPTINALTDDISDPANYIELNSPDPITICVQNAQEDRRASIIVGQDGTTSTAIRFDTYDESICGP